MPRTISHKRFFGVVEAVVLTLLGLAILWFALSANYGLLMNVRFRWLTVIGASLLLLMGITLLKSPQNRSGLNTVFFGLFLMIVFIGKPYTPNENQLLQLDSSIQEELWETIDRKKYPPVDLQALITTDAYTTFHSNKTFTTVGVAKRLNELDAHGSFSLMTTFMYCCVADMFAVGMRVPYEDLENIKDGQWLMVSGRLVEEPQPIELPNFRFGKAMLSSVNNQYYLKPEKITPYDRSSLLPPLTENLSGKTVTMFRQAIEKSGLWEELKTKKPLTILVPVNQAIEDLRGKPLSQYTQNELEQFISAHIIDEKLLEKDIMTRAELETKAGHTINITVGNGKVTINQSRILFKNIEARNGVIHYIYPAIQLPASQE